MRRVVGVGSAFLVATAIAFGCGDLLSLDSDSNDGVDASRIDASPIDASEDAGSSCDPNADFVEVRSLGRNVNTDDQEGTPTLDPEERTLLFGRVFDAGGVGRLFIARRESIDASFEVATELPIAGGYYEAGYSFYEPALAPDGQRLVFSVKAPDAGHLDLWISTKESGAWTTPVPLRATPEVDVKGAFASDGLRFYASSSPSDGGFLETMYVASLRDGALVDDRTVTGSDGQPIIGRAAVPSADENVLYFASFAINDAGRLTSDIERVTRNPDSTYGARVRLPGPVSSDAVEVPGWLSPDQCRLYFLTSREGTNDIYVARRR